MQTFGAFLVTLLAASGELAAALPSKMDLVAPRQEGQVVSVPVRPRSATTFKHPALSMARAVNKYNQTMPAHLDAIVKAYRNQKRAAETGSATTNPEASDEAYITDISIGTPAQTLPMDFDTGSSDLWVFSTETATNEVNGQKTYDPTSSTTAQKLTGATWSISYGDGSSSSGDVYMDVVTIGNITVSSQAVESATKVSDEFTTDSSSSGLVGLAMSSLNTVSPTAQKTFFDNAKASLAAGVFSADLKHATAGTYTFGAIDSSKFTGTMYYANLYNQTASLAGYWTFQSTGYAVGNGSTTTTTAATTTGKTGKKSGKNNEENFGGNDDEESGNGFFGLTKRSTRQHAPIGASSNARSVEKRAVTLTSTTITGIADTGTTLLMLDDSIVKDYYSQVSGAEDSTQEGGYVFPCDTTMPDFSFGVGDGYITVPGEYINWAAVDSTNTTCYGGLQSDASIGFSIFGDIALKSAYVVFDGAEGRVGWAAKTLS